MWPEGGGTTGTAQSLNPQRSSALKLFSTKKDFLVPMSAQLIITCYYFKDGGGVSTNSLFFFLPLTTCRNYICFSVG